MDGGVAVTAAGGLVRSPTASMVSLASGASRTARRRPLLKRRTGPAGIPCASESVASARCSHFGCLCSLGAGVDGRRASPTSLLRFGRQNEGVSLVVSRVAGTRLVLFRRSLVSAAAARRRARCCCHAEAAAIPRGALRRPAWFDAQRRPAEWGLLAAAPCAFRSEAGSG
jgi:Rieske Fe-S protein